jgi:hypothetical protein
MIHLLFGFCVLFFSTLASTAEPQSRLSARMIFDEKDFLIAASFDGPITIECVKGCASKTRLTDDPGGTLIGAFRLTDADSLLYTTWVSGTAYRIAIYSVHADSVKKVFDEYTLSGVDLLGASANGPVIRAKQYITQSSRKTVVRSWQWNAARKVFVPAGKR